MESAVDPATVSRPARRDRVVDGTLVVVAVLPVVLAVARSIANRYVPVTDDALLTIRAWDVFSRNIPLLGSGTSASSAIGEPMSNLGPWQFYLASVPVRLFGPGPGVAIAMGALNATYVAGAMWIGRRLAGRAGLLAVGLPMAVLAHAMGSELLYDIWQPNAMLLPSITLAVAFAAVVAGHARLLPAVVALASLVAQTHLSYVYSGAAAVVVGLVVTAWATRSADEDRARTARRCLAGSAVVLAVAWLPTIIEQLAGPGEGNLSRLLRAVGKQETLGPAGAARLIARQMVSYPWFTRPGFRDGPPAVIAFERGRRELDHLASPVTATIALAATVVVALVLVIVGWRRRDRVARSCGLVTLGVLAVGVGTASALPFGTFGVAGHHTRFVTGTLTALVALVALGSVSLLHRPRLPTTLGRATTGLAAAVLVAVSGANLPAFTQPLSGPASESFLHPTVHRLDQQLGVLEGRGVLAIDARFWFFGERYASSLFLELTRRGVPFRTDSDVDVRQLGEGRRLDGPVDGTIILAQGDDAVTPPNGFERVVFLAGLGPLERGELDSLRALTAPTRRQQRRLERLEHDYLQDTVAVFYRPGSPG